MAMRMSDSSAQPFIATLEHLGKRYAVTCRVAFDGIEYVGRLWFAEEAIDDVGLPDRAAIPGRSRRPQALPSERATMSGLSECCCFGIRH